ncbi:MAG: adenylosuccinate lyase [Deltaproteobacteria bacterium RIFCSPLOWO2_12_FULL_40_28]|nr:MAG: adenylosuccinate lyase [Deltaproteobacteria bacterium RIFCSPHIGHO2_02_FULL_40_28]OGQ20815.1 MAG: adenylosuccinate lyase [Deltaproteobacteria bacterium RIFCSPHIGHO2_12_FULL_40_32]OGQ39216.1 MAG: adenylosuccinate lyase [Deltaproteobacteria bacterium RIFCSPLOWO2_02_FULL_40_36]OGQ54497.1 MAG: adenylosuccinate lyase [Deltaproteobacteria bacterium RIFCSPLOWO2_12_FULL_40_28]
MIPRYTRSMMSQIWEPENRFTIWLEIEILALEALVNKGEMSRDVVRSIRTKAKFNIERIETLEKELKHDVIAFLTCVAEFVGPDSRFIHKGLTSSDILDTAFAVQLKQAGDLLIQDIDSLMSILKLRAYEFKDTVMVGRSHGIHGEPVTFGLKLALWYEEMKRNRERLLAASTDVAVGKLSGAMGTFAHNDPFIEKYVCEKLGLKPDPISTQVVQRDRHAHFFQTLSLVGASLDKIATEIRHLQRTEVYEVEEYFSPGQKGSSAMPHKRNPVLSENISGLSRLLRGYALSAIENVALWHERDISHSSVERVIGPDATIVLDFMLDRSCGIISKLLVYPENMKTNLGEMKGLIYSQRVLLALIDAGMSREDAYKVVQKSAMKVWEQDADFLSELKKDDKISRYLNAQDLNPLFDVKYYLRHVDTLFKRIFI